MLKFKLWWENGKQENFWINDKKLWNFIEMKLEISKILIALKKRLIESWIVLLDPRKKWRKTQKNTKYISEQQHPV